MPSNYERFQQFTSAWAKYILKPKMETSRKSVALESVGRMLDYTPPSDAPMPSDLTPEEELFMRYFKAFNEVSNTLDVIEDMKIYVSRFPFGRTRISRERYLSLQISTYLNEIYILKTRLISFARLIKDTNKLSANRPVIDSAMGPMFSYIADSFRGIEDTRGSHVHTARYHDDDILRIATFEMLSKYTDWGEDHLNEAYKFARRKWLKTIATNQIAIDGVIDTFFLAAWRCIYAPEARFDMAKLHAPVPPGP
ncbi:MULTISPECIES: hypothetical protein [unclassified Cupriavidus]|uniref:hypothetical protein n=1 Tax=unclassified Cupriavidus TaxID=2640874 RepID=UPI00313B20EC